jgi:hypothetical protein
MKIACGVIFTVIIGVVGWRLFAPAPRPVQRSVPDHQLAAPRPIQRPVTKPQLAASQSIQRPVAKPALAAHPTPPKRLAPEGTYFLLQRSSLTTNSGVIGFAPGTKVTLVGRNGSTITVTDGKYQLNVEASQLTNDLAIATTVAQSDFTAQKKIANIIETYVKEYSKQQQSDLDGRIKEQARIDAWQRSGQRAPNSLVHGN